MRDLVVTVAGVALTAVAVSLLAGCGSSSSSSSASTQGSSASPQQRAEAAARHFLDRYVDGDGRVVRRDQGGDTVGEGQAYGMLMAAAIGDRRRFDKIWNWTKANLQRPDGLISFLWRDGHVVDPQAASDADLDGTGPCWSRPAGSTIPSIGARRSGSATRSSRSRSVPPPSRATRC